MVERLLKRVEAQEEEKGQQEEEEEVYPVVDGEGVEQHTLIVTAMDKEEILKRLRWAA